MYLYLPKGEERVKYDDCVSSIKLWYPEFALMSFKYLTHANLGKMSLRDGPLWLGLNRTNGFNF